MKKSLVLILALVVALSCSDDGIQNNQTKKDVVVENGRLVFQNVESFLSTLSRLDKMDSEGLARWRSQFTFNSMNDRLAEFYEKEVALPKEYEEYSHFPNGYQNILNGNAEVKIGSEVIWYNQGAKHHAVTEAELAGIRSNPDLDTNAGKYILSTASLDNTEGARVVHLVRNDEYYNVSDDYAFKTTCTDGKSRRYINKLHSLVDDFVTFHNVTLFFCFELRYKNPSGDWVASNHARRVDWDFTTVDIESEDPAGCAYNQTTTPVSGSTGVWANAHYHYTLMGETRDCPASLGGWHDITLVGTVNEWIVNGNLLCHQWTNNW